MPKVFGIRGASHRGVKSIAGIGIEHHRSDDGWMGISGNAGDIVMLANPFVTYQLAIGAQAVGSAVTLEFSLCNPTMLDTMNFQDQSAYWVKSTTVSPGDITRIDWTFSVLKATFSTAAELYLVAR